MGFYPVTLIGASTAAFTPIAWSIIQETTPNHLMGRVFTLINTASMAMASGGMVAFGGVADNFGSMAGISMIGFVFMITGMVVILLESLLHSGRKAFSHGRKWNLRPMMIRKEYGVLSEFPVPSHSPSIDQGGRTTLGCWISHHIPLRKYRIFPHHVGLAHHHGQKNTHNKSTGYSMRRRGLG